MCGMARPVIQQPLCGAGVCVSYEGVEDAVDLLLRRVTDSPVDAVPWTSVNAYSEVQNV